MDTDLSRMSRILHSPIQAAGRVARRLRYCSQLGRSGRGVSVFNQGNAARYRLLSRTEEVTQALAENLASDLRAGDCYSLLGDVGAGKSAFSRAFIRSAIGDPELPVASPTFLLQNIYDDLDGPPIHHFDLYRLPMGAGLERLELEQSWATAVSLVEWGNNLAGHAPASRLDVTFSLVQEEGREAEETARLDTTEETHAPRTRYERIGPGTRQYEDNRARIIMLQPHGPAWTKRLQGAWHLLQTHPMLASCLLPPG